jgi:hypothetical protein
MSTDSDGNVVYKLSGVTVQNLLLDVDKMNVTVVFRKPLLSLKLHDGLRELGNLAAGMSALLIAPFSLLPVVISSTFQPTMTYEINSAKWFVPCPQPVARKGQVMHTYQLPVWLTVFRFLNPSLFYANEGVWVLQNTTVVGSYFIG